MEKKMVEKIAGIMYDTSDINKHIDKYIYALIVEEEKQPTRLIASTTKYDVNKYLETSNITLGSPVELLGVHGKVMDIECIKEDIKLASISSDVSVCLYCFELDAPDSTRSFINEFTESVKNNIKNKSDFSSSIFDLMVKVSNEDIIFVKLYGYVKIFKNLNNEIFKFNNFLEFFQNWIKKYSIINISYIRKEEIYIFKNNTLKTPMEII